MTKPHALWQRLSEAPRNALFVNIAEGHAQGLVAVRQMRWYDALNVRIYQLERLLEKG